MSGPYTHPACSFNAHHICKGYAYKGKELLTCHCDCHQQGQQP